MRLRTRATRLRASVARALRPLATLALLLAAACASEAVVHSGGDLPPGSRARLTTKGPVSITKVDSQEARGRNVEVAPGTYRVQFTARLRMEKVDESLRGAVHKLTCETEISVSRSETVELRAGWDTQTKSEGSGNRYERVIDGRKVSIDPKVEVSHLNRGTTKRVPLTQCESFIDCRRVESRWVTTSGCDRY